MKKILYLSDVAIDSVGGAQESMKLIIEELKSEFEFYMITPNSKVQMKNQIIYKEYQHFILKKLNKIEIITILKRLKKDIKNINPDIIHIQMQATMLMVGFLRVFNLIKPDTKIIYTDRGVLNKYGKFTQIALKIFINKFDKLVTTTHANGINYKKLNYIKDSCKHSVIPNAAGYMFDIYEDEKKLKIREKYGIRENELVIGFSGRQADAKNWPLAIDIIEELNKSCRFKVCICLGTDKTKDNIKEAKSTIESIIEIIGQERVINFIDIPLELMSDIYYMNDIFILSSKDESFGRTAIEAMSRKNIVFGTNVDGLQEVVYFEENKYRNVDEFMQKINPILKSQKLINQEKEKFFNHYNENYTTNICIENYKKLYENML